MAAVWENRGTMNFRPTPLWARLVGIILLSLIAPVGVSAAETPGGGAPIRLGVLRDNYPFSFVGADGRMQGFSYELMREVELVMGLRFERVEGMTKEINAAFLDGRIDMLQSFADFPEREATVDFSVPYLTMGGAIFVGKDVSSVRTLADLHGRRILVHKNSLGETVLRKAGLGEFIVYVDSVEDALGKLERGEGDATLAARLTGLALAYHRGLKRVKIVPGKVDGFEVRYCVAVKEGEGRLLAQINEGLAVLVRTGRFDALYRKWFSQVEPVGYTFEQVLLAVAVGLTLALVVALWAVWRQRRLHRQIARQATELRAGEERYRGLFEGAPDGLLLLEAATGMKDAVIVQTNPSARRLLQIGSGPAPGTRLSAVLGGDSVLADRLVVAVATGRAVEFEHEKPGAAGWWRVSASPLGGRLLVSLRDITEQTQARQRLQKQDEHMRHTQKIEAIGTLAGGIAHDFNNLLTSIMGNTQLTLLNLPPGHPEIASLEQVMKAGRRAQQLVKQILTFSRRSEASRNLVKISPLIEEAMGFLRSVARGTVEFEHRADAADTEILADPAQVHQVLMNIGTNALQAMRGTPGRLAFVEEIVEPDHEAQIQHGLKPGRYLRVTVQDTGPGMTRDVLDRIFEPFFTTKPLGEGTGLGLSVVHGIMQQHDGGVTVTSEPGRGTRFQLYFPVTRGTAVAPSDEPAGAIVSGLGQSLLLVDDDPSIVETVKKILQRLGYAVSAHLRADEALVQFEAAPDRFALALSDLTMPGLNGLQFAARVRALRPELPLVLVSGYWGESDLVEARRLNVTATLHKPLTYDMLGRLVAEHLPRP
jgi:two-component system cell cycle sensor histidine kinase/response regulator CckA